MSLFEGFFVKQILGAFQFTSVFLVEVTRARQRAVSRVSRFPQDNTLGFIFHSWELDISHKQASCLISVAQYYGDEG